MRALAIVHKYPPIHNAGAEWMLHAILRDWTARGADCFVVFAGAPAYELDGVTVGRTPARGLERLCREVDVVVTHLDNTGAATRAARIAERPIVHLLHNDRQLQYHNVKPAADTLLVANSEWIRATVPAGFHHVLTCRPPVFTADYEVDRAGADYVTLVNRTEPKGAAVVFDLAAREPERRFLAVAGAYGVQMRPPARVRNVELRPQTAAIRDDVYAVTRVVLMPSSYESWGRVAVEAGAAGIPVIAHPTPGLTEALGDAGIFADRAHVREWQARLAELDDAGRYADASARARARSLELEEVTAGDLAELWHGVTSLAGLEAYDSPVTLIRSGLAGMRTAARCPVCHAERCSCTGSTIGKRVTSGGVIFVDGGARTERGPIAVYRTYRGDFRYSPAGAAKAGLIPSPGDSNVPLPVARRFARAQLSDLEAAYSSATEDARGVFLASVAVLNPQALAAVADDLIRDLATTAGGATRDPTPAPREASAAGPPVTGRVGDVLGWAANDPSRLEAALAAERDARNRPTLIAELERRLAGTKG